MINGTSTGKVGRPAHLPVEVSHAALICEGECSAGLFDHNRKRVRRAAPGDVTPHRYLESLPVKGDDSDATQGREHVFACGTCGVKRRWGFDRAMA